MDSEQEIALTQMRKSVEKLGSSTEVSDYDAIYLYVLRWGFYVTVFALGRSTLKRR